MKSKVGIEEFIKIWQESESVKDAATKLGISYNGAYSRAKFYRGKGIKLKKHDVAYNKYDLAALNALCEKYE